MRIMSTSRPARAVGGARLGDMIMTVIMCHDGPGLINISVQVCASLAVRI